MDSSALPYEQFDVETFQSPPLPVSRVSRKCKKIALQSAIVALIGAVILIIIIISSDHEVETLHRRKKILTQTSPTTLTTTPSSTKKPPAYYENATLPGDIRPMKYRIHLHPNMTSHTFSGDVKILLEVITTTDSIQFNAKTLNITHLALYKSSDLNISVGSTPLRFIKVDEDREGDRISIQLAQSVLRGEVLVLHAVYSAILEKSYGLYMTTYNTQGGHKRRIIATHTEPTGARMIFPCFDEPSMKARFQVNMAFSVFPSFFLRCCSFDFYLNFLS